MNERKLTLVYTENADSRYAWEETYAKAPLVVAGDRDLLREALFSAEREGRGEIERVILDESIDSVSVLSFLASLPIEFRGEVLSIQPGGKGFLSSIARGDGRMLYELGSDDLAFYFRVKLDPLLDENWSEVANAA